MKIFIIVTNTYPIWGATTEDNPTGIEITDEQYAGLLAGTHRISDDGSGGCGGGVQTTTYKAAA